MSHFFIFADRVVDGIAHQPLQKGGVLVSDRVIQWVGEADNMPREVAAGVKNYPGATLLPGLVDAHVHLSMMGSNDPWNEMISDNIPIATLKAAVNAKLTLQSGVTTVRDLGSKEGAVIHVANSIDDGLIEGCRVQPAGRCIVMTGGHGYAMGVEVDGHNEARKAARQELKSGAKVLKVMATGGVLTPGVEPGSPQLSIEEMKAITEEAHHAGRKVAAHAHGGRGIKNALRAGCDTVEHCSYLDPEAIDLFKEKDAIMVSTLLATMELIWNLESSMLPHYVVEKIKRHVDHEIASLEMAIAARLKIAAGTDAGSGVNPHNHLTKQLSLLVKHGMNPVEAIQAGTRISAEALGLVDRIGTIEAGKSADLIIVRGDPTSDIDVMDDRIEVIKSGRFITC